MDAATVLEPSIQVPATPPRAWFDSLPDWYDPAGPLVQIDRSTGRVAALVAPYGECNLDGLDDCWKPPTSATGYEYAHVGGLLVDDGTLLRVANIGGGVGHAPMTASSGAAQSHYADTTTRRMVGRYQDRPDDGGIFFLGSMWPGSTMADVVEASASAVSGDWRWIRSVGGYELCGAQLVNVPGFRPVPGLPRVAAAFAITLGPGAHLAGASVVGAQSVRGEWHQVGVDRLGEAVSERIARVAAVALDLLPEVVDDEMPEPLGVDLAEELTELDDDACVACAGVGCDACGHIGYPEPHTAASSKGAVKRAKKILKGAVGGKGGFDAKGFWHDPNSGKFAEKGYVSPGTLRRLLKGDEKSFKELRANIDKNYKPGMGRDELVHLSLGPQPHDPDGKNGWIMGFKEVTRRHALLDRTGGNIESRQSLKDRVKQALTLNGSITTPADHPDGNSGFGPARRPDGSLTLNYVWDGDRRSFVPDTTTPVDAKQSQVDAELAKMREAAKNLPSTKDPAARAIALDALLDQVHKGDLPTDAQYNRRGEDGKQWSEERTALHEEILDEVMRRIEEAGIPKDREALFLGGPPGAGKSTALSDEKLGGALGVIPMELEKSDVEPGANAVALNPDAFKEIMARMYLDGRSEVLPDTGLKPMEMATFMHEESSWLTEQLERRLLDQGYNIVHDGTMNKEKSIRKKLDRLKEADYDLPNGLFVKISTEESSASAAGRYARSADSDLGGRFVPSSISKEAEPPPGYEGSSLNHFIFDKLTAEGVFEEGLTVDNSGVSEGKPKKLVLSRIENGQKIDYKEIVTAGPRKRTVKEVMAMDGVGGGDGTKENPFRVSDPRTAVQLLGDGQYELRFYRPDEVATVLSALAEAVKVAKDLGVKAPTFNLCAMSVPGTNLFCAESVGYKRTEMPQLSTSNPVPGSFADSRPRDEWGVVDLTDDFIDYLTKEHGLKLRKTKKKASHLRASQNELNGGKVAKIIETGLDPTRPIFVNGDDNYVIDGHHRWAAGVGEHYTKGGDVEIDAVEVVGVNIIDLLEIAKKWTVEMGSPPVAAAMAPPDEARPGRLLHWRWKED